MSLTVPKETEHSLALVHRGSDALQVVVGDVARRYQRIAAELMQVTGPRAGEVRAAASRLRAVLELFQQEQRRQNAEALRSEQP
jgi:hypothetical protein